MAKTKVERQSIKIIRGALDESREKSIILRGVLDTASLKLLQTGDYQREVLPLATINDLKEAFKKGRVPDIELGMRGEDVKWRRTEEEKDVFFLYDPIFVIDGLQRVTAAIEVINEGGVIMPHLGAVVHFNTDEAWERNRFMILNARRSKLSPNVLARNHRHEWSVIDHLFRMTKDSRNFVLRHRVCWDQRMKRDHLLNATTYLKVVGYLHAHIGPGKASRIDELIRGLQTIMERTGEQVFRDNVRYFFDVVDQCWGVRTVRFKEGATYLRFSFLVCLATVFSRHHHVFFKNGKRLMVAADFRRKIAQFPITDPYVKELSSASGKARNILYQLMIEHINRGKRTRRLIEPGLEEDDSNGNNGDNDDDNDEN